MGFSICAIREIKRKDSGDAIVTEGDYGEQAGKA